MASTTMAFTQEELHSRRFNTVLFTEAQANELFDILLESGNHPCKPGGVDESNQDWERQRFVKDLTNDFLPGSPESYFVSNHGAKVKLYYREKVGGTFVIYVIGQDYDEVHEPTKEKELNDEVQEFVKRENAKRLLQLSQQV